MLPGNVSGGMDAGGSGRRNGDGHDAMARCRQVSPWLVAALTTLVMTLFAANSLLCRFALAGEVTGRRGAQHRSRTGL